MRITCCHCGERDSAEFVCHGAVHGRRPAAQEEGAPRKFYEHVYLRDNVRGRHDEYWYHAYGCRTWLRVTRDTRTHEVIAVNVAMEGKR